MFELIKTGYLYGKLTIFGKYEFENNGWGLFKIFLFWISYKIGRIIRKKRKRNDLLAQSLKINI